jgi:hypothetical protein
MGRFSSLVVDDLDVVRVAVPPHEAQPELVVHTNRVPAFAVALQGFPAVGGRNSQVVKVESRTTVTRDGLPGPTVRRLARRTSASLDSRSAIPPRAEGYVPDGI